MDERENTSDADGPGAVRYRQEAGRTERNWRKRTGRKELKVWRGGRREEVIHSMAGGRALDCIRH